MSRRLLVGLVLASLAMAVGFWLKWRVLSPLDPEAWFLTSASQFGYTDFIYIYIDRNIAFHPVPYLEASTEYPPVVGAVMYVASFADGPEGYLVANYAILALAGLGTVWAVYQINRNALLWIFAATPPLVFYAGLNWDLLAIFFAMLSLALFKHGRVGLGGAMLALGVWSKLFPALLLLPIMVQKAREGRWRDLGVIAVSFGLVTIVVNVPLILVSYSGWSYAYVFHALRPPDGGSLWSSFGLLPVGVINGLSAATVALGMVLVCYFGAQNRRSLLEQGFAALALFVLVNKTSSPQYHLWLMPFLAIVPPPLWLLGLFLGVDLAYYWSSFQVLFLQWGGQSSIGDAVLTLADPIGVSRQLVLLLLFFWITLRQLRLPQRARLVPVVAKFFT